MSKTYNEALLQRVEEYLASSGLSQNKMAQAVGLSQTALSNWRRKIYNGDPAYVEGKLKEYFETQAARDAQRQAGSIASAWRGHRRTASATAHYAAAERTENSSAKSVQEKRALGEITSGGGIVAVAAHIIRSPAPTR